MDGTTDELENRKQEGASLLLVELPSENLSESSTPPVHWHLFCAVSATNLAIFCAGTTMSWSSPSLPKLSGPDPEGGFSLTPSDAAWTGSLLPLAAAFFPLPAGMLGERFGRRSALFVSAGLLVLSWMLVAAATSPGWLFASRALAGAAVGVMSANIPIYLGEVCPDKVRSAVGSAMQVWMTAGMMLPFAVGPFLSVRDLALTCCAAAVAFGAGLFAIPESPFALLMRGEVEAAARALQWLRGQSREDVAGELRAIQDETKKVIQNKRPLSETLRLIFSSKGNRLAFVLCNGLFMFQQFSGYNAVIFYAEGIFRAAGTDLSPALSAALVGVVQVVASAMTVALTARFSMRHLFIASSLLSALAHAALGYFFFAQARGDGSGLAALPLTSLVVYNLVYCIGLGAVPWALVGEIFAPDVKGLSSSISASLFWVEGFVIAQVFSQLLDLAGPAATFWGFSGSCLLSAVFALAALPDTRGKSLQEIQDLLNKS